MVRALEQVETAGRGDLRIAPLSYGQEGLWLLQHLYPGNSALNLFRALRTAKPLVPSALALSISEIVRRHEILRTNFRIIDGRPMQVIRPSEPMSVGFVDFSHLLPPERKAGLVRWLRARTSEPFDLENDDLLRSYLIHMSDDEDVIFFNLHHIVCDGWSLGVLFYECIYNKVGGWVVLFCLSRAVTGRILGAVSHPCRHCRAAVANADAQRPFEGTSESTLSALIQAANPKYAITSPPVSLLCLYAIKDALEPRPEKRLGSTWESFINHDFFAPLNFDALERKEIEAGENLEALPEVVVLYDQARDDYFCEYRA